MDTNDEPDLSLLDRYRTGECPPDERARVERWIAAHPTRARQLDWLRALEAAAQHSPEPWDVSALWTGLRDRLDPPLVLHRGTPERPRDAETAPAEHRRAFRLPVETRRTPWSVHLLRAAAILVMLAGAAALWRVAIHGSAAPARTTAMRSYTARPGQRAEIRLIDGSRVTLGAGSRLDVPENYGDQARDVFLRGRAYFEVEHDAARPFRVHSRETVTEDRGTRFDVQAYDGDPSVDVLVAEGSVVFWHVDSAADAAAGDGRDAARRPAHGGVMLGRGDLARLDSGGVIQVRHDVAVGDYIAWTQGRLEFRNEPLRDVIPQLDRWYDLDIRLVDPSLGARPLTMSLESESADEMLRILAASLDLHARRSGHVVTLGPNLSTN